MYTLLMTLFVILCFCLAGVVLFLQQGKGDLGLGSMAGNQMLFGGSGGQGFFEKATWIMGALFICGSLGLSILKSKHLRSSVLEGIKVPVKNTPFKAPAEQEAAQATGTISQEATNETE